MKIIDTTIKQSKLDNFISNAVNVVFAIAMTSLMLLAMNNTVYDKTEADKIIQTSK